MIPRFAFLGLALLAAGATVAPVARPGPWLGGLAWVDHAPLTAADLDGKVVVVEFWAFECVNCRRTLPAMRQLASDYRSAKDVVIVGIHTPELEVERNPENVRAAVKRFDLRFAVARDDDYAAWRAFGNQYWPALYVLDRHGVVRARHIGELHLDTAAWHGLQQTIAKLRRERG
jgi:thiol-disulfide isomerase/thioredoxin